MDDCRGSDREEACGQQIEHCQQSPCHHQRRTERDHHGRDKNNCTDDRAEHRHSRQAEALVVMSTRKPAMNWLAVLRNSTISPKMRPISPAGIFHVRPRNAGTHEEELTDSMMVAAFARNSGAKIVQRARTLANASRRLTPGSAASARP